MFEETEGLPDCSELAQRYRTKHVPPKRVETLPMLTHASQFDTYLLRFWHGLRFGRTIAAFDLYARALDLRFRWRKLASLLLVLKSSRLVSAIAERLICRVPTAAESDCCASGKAIRLALHVNELDFSFDTQGAIISNYDFS